MKFCGKVGYAETKETSPGVWVESDIVERIYYGDVTRYSRKYDRSEQLNDNLSVNCQISIVADAYAYNHFHNMRYIQWMGTLWKISDIEVERPRLTLTLGGVYNGPTPEPADDAGGDDQTVSEDD